MKIPSVKKSVWRLLTIALIVTIFTAALLLCPYENQNKTSVEPIRFSGTYQLNDGTPPQPLTDSTYINAYENSFVTFRGTFNQILKKNIQLLFFMEYLEVHIYLDDREIYTWGTEENRPSMMRSAGAAWGHCVLPTAISQNDEITISLESKYTNNYNSAYHDFLDSLQIGDSGALARTVLTKNWPYLLTGLLLFLVGLTLQLFLLSLARQGVTIHPSVYYCAFFILSASLWIFLNPEYSTLIWGNAPLIMLLETVSMWLFSTFLFGYFGTFMQTRAKRANDLLLLCFASALVLFLVLQLFGVTDAYAVREPHNILLGVSGVALLFIFWYEVQHAKKSKLRTLALPGLLYIVFGLIEMLNYEFEWLQRGMALTFGFAIFIIVQFVLAVGQIRDSLLMKVKAASLEKALLESRTAVMLSQIQPHFLHNSLQNIKQLCDVNPPKASEALEHFAHYLRGNMDALTNARLIPFEEELEHITDYIYLEKMRFPKKLNIVMDVSYQDFLLPPLSVQPIIENAIRHGITKKKGGGTLTIRCEGMNETVVITVNDDGVGFDPTEKISDGRAHLGVENTRKRLEVLCDGSLLLESEKGVGTTVKMILPRKEATK